MKTNDDDQPRSDQWVNPLLGAHAAETSVTPPSARTTDEDTADGVAVLHVDITVRVSAMRDWSPERIAAFFSGLAQAVTARGANWSR